MFFVIGCNKMRAAGLVGDTIAGIDQLLGVRPKNSYQLHDVVMA